MLWKNKKCLVVAFFLKPSKKKACHFAISVQIFVIDPKYVLNEKNNMGCT